LNGAHQLSADADDVNIAGEDKHTARKTQQLYWMLVRRLVYK
jgi:hypothetical protein